MATVNEILGIRSYEGNAAAGGGQVAPIKLDATPFDKLAQYTFYQNRDKWEKQNQQDKEAAAELAKLSTLDPTTTDPKLYEYLNGIKTKIFEQIQRDPSSLSYQKNPKGYTDLFKMYGDFSSARNKVSQNDLLLNADLSRAAKITDPTERAATEADIALKYSEQLKDGAQAFINYKPLLATGFAPKPEEFSLPEIGQVDYTTVKIGGNENTATQIKVKDYNQALGFAYQEAAKMAKRTFTPEPNPNNDPNIAKRNEAARLSFNATQKNKLPYLQQNVDNLKNIYSQWLTKDKEWQSAPAETRGERPAIPDFVQARDLANQRIDAANEELQRQSTNGGRPSVDLFKRVDFDDSFDVADLLYANTVVKQQNPIVYDEKVTQTDNDLQRSAQAETIRHNKAIEGLNWAEYNLKKDAADRVAFAVGNTTSGSAYEAFRDRFDKATANSNKKILKLSELDPAVIYALNPSLIQNDKGALKYGLPKDGKVVVVGTDGNSDLKGGINDIYVSLDRDGNILFQDKSGNGLVGYGLDKVARRDAVDATGVSFLTTLNKETKGQQSPYYTGNVSNNKVDNGTAVNLGGGGTTTINSTRNGGSSSNTATPKRTTITQSEVAQKAAAAGYTVSEYANLLRQKGIKIQ